MKLRNLFLSFLFISRLQSQTLGGSSVFNFLTLPHTPQLTALGGINITQPSADIGLAFNNPALLKQSMHSQMNAVFTSMYAGIKDYHLSIGYHHPKLNTNFSWGLSYINYGAIQETDASGNIYGKIHPVDWVMQVSASRSYLEKWNYGMTLKYISSNYGLYKSNGMAMDVGLLYSDTARSFFASVLAKNMGFQLKKYQGTDPDDLPFDLEAGITKRLENAPFSFSFTAHHLQHFNIQYSDTAFNNSNGYENEKTASFSIDKLFRHFVFAATAYIGDKIEVMTAYNYLRRKELNISNSGNGLNGFSLGVGVLLGKIDIRYARSWYQNNTAYNQFGLNLMLNKYFGLGKFGERIAW